MQKTPPKPPHRAKPEAAAPAPYRGLPWRASGRPILHSSGSFRAFVVDKDSRAIAMVYGVTEDECASILRLLAAAPDAAASVREMRQHASFDAEGDLSRDEFEDMVDRAKGVLTDIGETPR